MDILKAEIARKRKLLEEKELLGSDKKYFKRGELIAKEQEEYRKKYYTYNETDENSTAVTKGEKIESDVQHSVLPRQEVIIRLRDRNEPILLFGESETDAFKRLRRCELLEPEVNKGFRNDFQEAMEQVDQAYLNELLKESDGPKSSEKLDKTKQEPTIGYEQIREMAKSMGRGNREHDMTVIVHFIQLPKTATSWREVSNIFEGRWNLPHCLGAIDGKHVVLQAPMNSGSEFFNYKSTFSIVLFALVDGNYNFMFADIGCQGRISDGGVFQGSTLHSMLTENTLGFPVPEKLQGRSMEIPYFFVGDGAFALSENLMKPYPGDFAKGTPQRIFNYRLSRARRIVENAFGIASAVFRVLRKPMLLEPEKAELIVMTVLLLHNYLREHSPNIYTPAGTFDHEVNGVITDGTWRILGRDKMTSMLPMRQVPRRSTNYSQQIRDEIADYLMNEGFLEWQHKYA